MRIAIDSRPLAGPICGIRRYTEALVRRLAAMGCECYLYSTSPISFDIGEQENITIRCGNLTDRSLASALFAATRFSSWLTQDKPDIFWSPRHQLPFYIPADCPSAVTIHDVVWKEFPETMDWRTRLLERFLTPRSLHQASSIICVSKHTRDSVSQFWPELSPKLEIVYSGGVDLQSCNKTPSCEPISKKIVRHVQPYMLFVGTAEPRKNLPNLIAAYAQIIRKKLTEARLILVANDGWGQLDLHRLLRENYSDLSSISIVSNISDDELLSLYRSANCLLIPSLSEGFGLPVVEALQQGTPVIASNRGALPEILEKSGLYCDPLSIESISNTMMKMLGDMELHKNLSAAALDRGNAFSWERCAKDTLRIFRQHQTSD